MTHPQPLPIFPTEGAIDLTARTPLALQFEEATEQAITALDRTGMAGISQEHVAALARTQATDFLDAYARDLAEAALKAAAEDGGPYGVLALWHGAEYTIGLSDEIPAGHLVEHRCACRSRRTTVHSTAHLN